MSSTPKKVVKPAAAKPAASTAGKEAAAKRKAAAAGEHRESREKVASHVDVKVDLPRELSFIINQPPPPAPTCCLCKRLFVVYADKLSCQQCVLTVGGCP